MGWRGGANVLWDGSGSMNSAESTACTNGVDRWGRTMRQDCDDFVMFDRSLEDTYPPSKGWNHLAHYRNVKWSCTWNVTLDRDAVVILVIPLFALSPPLTRFIIKWRKACWWRKNYRQGEGTKLNIFIWIKLQKTLVENRMKQQRWEWWSSAGKWQKCIFIGFLFCSNVDLNGMNEARTHNFPARAEALCFLLRCSLLFINPNILGGLTVENLINTPAC